MVSIKKTFWVVDRLSQDENTKFFIKKKFHYLYWVIVDPLSLRLVQHLWKRLWQKKVNTEWVWLWWNKRTPWEISLKEWFSRKDCSTTFSSKNIFEKNYQEFSWHFHKKKTQKFRCPWKIRILSLSKWKKSKFLTIKVFLIFEFWGSLKSQIIIINSSRSKFIEIK